MKKDLKNKVVAMPNRAISEIVATKFIKYQAQNIPSEKWVTLATPGAEIQVAGKARDVEAAVSKINSIQKLVEKDFAAREAHIFLTSKGEAFFKQGDLMFSVDAKDLNNVVGSNGGDCPIDKLMDSQLVMMAQANSFPVTPFVRELLRPVLIGLLQNVWYRDIEGHESDHLHQNQMARITLYLRQLSEYKASPEVKSNGTRPHAPKSDKWAKSYQAVAKWKGTLEAGREAQVLDVVRGLKKASTLAEIVEASKGKVETKQDLGKIVNRFVTRLVQAGAIQEVNSGTNS